MDGDEFAEDVRLRPTKPSGRNPSELGYLGAAGAAITGGLLWPDDDEAGPRSLGVPDT